MGIILLTEGFSSLGSIVMKEGFDDEANDVRGADDEEDDEMRGIEVVSDDEAVDSSGEPACNIICNKATFVNIHIQIIQIENVICFHV